MKEVDLLLIFGKDYLLDGLELLFAVSSQLEDLLEGFDSQRANLSVRRPNQR